MKRDAVVLVRYPGLTQSRGRVRAAPGAVQRGCAAFRCKVNICRHRNRLSRHWLVATLSGEAWRK